jgi:ABC-type branched-subunit amino acid transport system ATPase component
MILELENISISYSDRRGEVSSILSGVNLSVEEGGVTALIGGNGAGKTTLFNIVSGFEKACSGDVRFGGEVITGLPTYRISRKGIGRLFQGRQLMGDLTLMENMKVASAGMTGEHPLDFLLRGRAVRTSEAEREIKARQILSRLFGSGSKFFGMLDNKASEFSYGEQRLIAMARLLMGDYRLLLLDEPTSGVHPRHIDTFRTVIRRLVEQEGKTVFLIEHNMGFVRSVADHCHYLADGKIVMGGRTSDVLDNPVIRKDYMGL